LKEKKCTQIVVEDPAPDFQRMKDCVDLNMILSHGFFKSMHEIKNRDYLDQETFKLCSILE